MSFIDAASAAGLTPSAGLQKLEKGDRKCVRKQNGTVFSGSVNIDDSYRAIEPQANRWDYGIGCQVDGVEFAVWVEPHSATSTHEISTVLKKLQWMKDKLAMQEFSELRQLTERTRQKGLRQFWWVTTGRINIRSGTPQANKLAQAGLNFPCKLANLDRG